MLHRVSTRDRSARPGRAAQQREGTPRRSPHITPEGAKRLRAELDPLWTVERPRVTQEVADAAAQGDRSENAEYIYGKRRLREIDRRVRFLSKRLDEVKIVTEPPTDPSRVYFGAWVDVEDEDGAIKTYRIVGADESDL
jgi:transcription elongation factor GreB